MYQTCLVSLVQAGINKIKYYQNDNFEEKLKLIAVKINCLTVFYMQCCPGMYNVGRKKPHIILR